MVGCKFTFPCAHMSFTSFSWRYTPGDLTPCSETCWSDTPYLDSAGHEAGSPVIVVQGNNTNSNLTAFTKNVIEKYSNAKAGEMACSYKCSDHASAWEYGYPSAMVGESAFRNKSEWYPYIHTANDTIDHLDFDYMVEFVKVSAGFVAELAYTNFTALN